MKKLISAMGIALGLLGSGSPSQAQDAKKQPHPEAVADEAVLKEKVDLPGSKVVNGKAGDAVAKPKTGGAVVSGGKSKAASKQD
jgi:hypothetical protein